MLIDPDFKKLL